MSSHRLNAQEIVKNSLRRAGYTLGTDTPVETNKPLPDPIDWITQNFYLYDTGKLMGLYDCQIRPLQLALSRTEDGKFRFNTILWSWPKKSAKSSVIASVADYTAACRPRSSVKLVANDLKQADSRVGMYLRESIKLGQKAGDRDSAIRMTPSGYTTKYPNGSIIECVPIDPSGEAGGNDDIIVFSELHGWKSKAHQRMWSEMTLSPNKFGNSQRWIDTYAGFEGESPILEQLYEVGVKNGTQVWPDLEVYINETAKMLTVWVTKPMLPWQTSPEGQEYYAQEEAQLAPNEFLRMHRNQWVSSIEAFVPYEWWDACSRDQYEGIGNNEPCVLALDAGVISDCFAAVITTRRGEKVQVQYARKWQPQNNVVLDYAPIEAEIRRLINTYNVLEVCYDEFQLVDMMGRIRSEEAVNVRKFSQSAPRAVADKRLFDLIRDRKIQHRNEADLNGHVKNANRKPEDENKLRIIKRTPQGKIDLCVALSMSADRCFAYAWD